MAACLEKIGVEVGSFAFEKSFSIKRRVFFGGRVITGLTSIFGNDNITPLLTGHELVISC